MKISVAVIVRNEEDCIQRCLTSIIGKFDEYVIIDNGSKDRTIPLIKNEFEISQTPYKLIETVWNDDFSAQRNIAIENATGNAIFFIDADEILLSSQDVVRRSFSEIETPSENLTAICPAIKNHDDNIIKNIPRGFLLNKGFYYYGFVHEELRIHGNKKVKKIICNINLSHHGYNHDILIKKGKVHRNSLLNKRNILAEPKNARWVYFYCRDSIGFIDNEKIYSIASFFLLDDKNQPFTKDNIIKSNHTVALLNLMIEIKLEDCYNSVETEGDVFFNLFNIIESLDAGSSNVFFYKKMHDLFIWKRKAKENLIQVIRYINDNKDKHGRSLHSEGYHIDQLLGIYLYENKMFSESYRVLELISETGYSTKLLRKYHEYFRGCQR